MSNTPVQYWRSILKNEADVEGLYPVTPAGNQYFLVIIDYFMKWPEVYPTADQEAAMVADQVVWNWVSRFGVLLELHSDQGRNFKYNVCQKLSKSFNIGNLNLCILS